VIRPVFTLAAASLAVLLGMAGLVRGAQPQAGASAGPGAEPGVYVSGAYVRQSANGVNVAAYFTIYNTTDSDDALVEIRSGAGAVVGVHDSSGGTMTAVLSLPIPAKSSVVLTPGKYHVMIEKLYGPLKVGQTVNLQLRFRDAGDVLVTAPVVAIGAPAPTAVPPS